MIRKILTQTTRTAMISLTGIVVVASLLGCDKKSDSKARASHLLHPDE